MQRFAKRILLPAAILIVLAVGIAVGLIWRYGKELLESFEPNIRAEAIRYLEEHFQSDVQLSKLEVSLPKFSPWKLWRDKGKGSLAMVEGAGLVLRPRGRPDLPPLLKIADFRFDIDLGILSVTEKHVPAVYLNGMELVIPPKGQRDHIHMSPVKQPEAAEPPPEFKTDEDKKKSDVVIDTLFMKDSKLTILPKRKDRDPLEFPIQDLKMTSAGLHQPMHYEARLHNPKPSGWIHSVGTFGPWNSDEPGDSPMQGNYEFKDADLGVFKAIGGILQSTGTFQGTLDEVHAKGEARVPDFRLKRSNQPVPLTTKFEVLVDGTNGNTILQPVHARLGTSNFVTSGGIVKHEKERRRSIDLKVDVPKGEMKDFLKLAIGREPFLEGEVMLKFTIGIPPLDGKVKEKLILDGVFNLDRGRFLQNQVADKVEELSQRGKGQPGQDNPGDTLSQMHGLFHMEDQAITFRQLMFAVPGAKVDLIGGYDIADDNIDFHGSLSLDAKVSQTQTGWKRWAAKPLDPFFSKNGAGTFLKIKVGGTAKKPSFGLDRGKPDPKANPKLNPALNSSQVTNGRTVQPKAN